MNLKLLIVVESESGPVQQIFIERKSSSNPQNPPSVVVQGFQPQGVSAQAPVDSPASTERVARRDEAKRLVAASLPETEVAVNLHMKNGIFYQTASETKPSQEDPAHYEISQVRSDFFDSLADAIFRVHGVPPSAMFTTSSIESILIGPP